jgi:hypothetical protein
MRPALAEPYLRFAILSSLLACGPQAMPIDRGTGGTGGIGGSGQAGSGGAGGNSGNSGTGGNSGTSAADGGTTMAGTAIPLPMSVTAQFQNQGWFADSSLTPFFAPGATVIKQTDVTTGPCAMRAAQARGKCLKITYTPPAGLMAPPAGTWVGVFFLTTLLSDHAELVPPAKAGDANWGAEPGRYIAAGATKISFAAAAEVDGTSVSFKAGTDKDGFAVPETPEMLSTGWKTYELPLAGQSYGQSVVGAFAWILTDTTRPATFYLDDIVWR